MVGENAIEAENGPGAPNGPVTGAGPDPMTVFEASRTSTESWLCCVARPTPVTDTGLEMALPEAGVWMMIRSSVHPSSRHSQARSRPIAILLASMITNVVPDVARDFNGSVAPWVPTFDTLRGKRRLKGWPEWPSRPL